MELVLPLAHQDILMLMELVQDVPLLVLNALENLLSVLTVKILILLLLALVFARIHQFVIMVKNN